MAMQNFHLPLPSEVYQDLRATARRLGRPATQVARQALEAWLKKQRETLIHEEITAYAKGFAGTAQDLDEDLESAAATHLLGEQK
jgi:predicted DNA-binding protein